MCIGILAGACIILVGCSHRVTRQHACGIPSQYQGLTLRLETSRQGHIISKTEAEEDLDQLEWLIDHKYSYRDLKGVNYRACLDAIRSGLGHGITRGDFAYQLSNFLALFGDGHTKIASHSVSIKTMCSQFLPFLVSETKEGLVAYKEDRTDLLDPEYPFLHTLDGLPVRAWIQAAKQWVPDGSPHFVRLHSIRYLRCVEFLRKELGLNAHESIRVELESADGDTRKEIEIPLAKQKPSYGFWPRFAFMPKKIEDIRVETQLLDNNLGYLHIPLMLDTPVFLDSLVAAMHQFENTDGLVIDIRGNGGGSRAPLRILLPFFMTDDEPPQVVNVAAYRRGTTVRTEAFEARFLYPETSKHWSDAERQAIRDCLKVFQTEWPLPKDRFSTWHYFVISPHRNQETYCYDKPVIILQDTVNYSASDIFLGACKDRHNIILMGLPSGGGSGCRIKYRLQNSHIALYLSSMVSYRPNGQLYDGKGIKPDIYVYPQPEFFIAGKDNVLEQAVQFLKQMIRQRQVKKDNRRRFLFRLPLSTSS